jgi:hypothetical protein
MPAIESRLDVRSDEFLNNARAMGGLVSDLRSQVDRAAAGGGDTGNDLRGGPPGSGWNFGANV